MAKIRNSFPVFQREPVVRPNTFELVPNYNRKPGEKTHILVARPR